MKILFLLAHLTDGGVERSALNRATQWHAEGADVIVATVFPKERDPYAIPTGIRRVSLNISSKAGSIFSPISKNIVLLIRLRRLLRQERPDIVIAEMTLPAICLALARTSEGIAIGHEHFHPPSELWYGRAARMWQLLRRYFYARLDAVVALTPQSAEWLRENTRARNVVTIPNWVSLPLPHNEPRIAPNDIIPTGKKLLLAVGRLHPQKRFDRLLDAFAQVAPQHPDWRLVVLGEDLWKKGELRDELESQVEQLGLAKQVRLPGFAGNVADWYQSADALVLTSDYEGFPMTLLEAMAHGCPVISVDCPTGPSSVIRDGENGLLIPLDDFDALVGGIDKMLSDDALRAHLASNTTEVSETYSPARVNKLWQGLFNELLEKQNARKSKSASC